ncbi:MAG: DUF5615 family PIN-like protein [Anaerolineae bacterium]|nr:DUF5615 family PIN-like protein [Anaerolineae bacterium]MCX8066524.1 DUF5615 family PIN-like protein [Anaerolineae bacterium]MDW7990548.1 DUF5615 family PIN-like protein [Anaerolineae bacterium]MDW8068713.1 DUF5615 family PIN-like protein [Anaerolineae bacterium]
MRLLLDQNLRVQTKEFPRQLGYDVVDTRDSGLSRATDREIAEAAMREDRIIVTYNSDFGDVRDFPPGSYPGVIRLRVHPQTDEVLHPRLAEFLSSVKPEQLRGALVVLDNVKARIRKPR